MIIGILVAIAVPVFGAVQTNAANRAHEANRRTLHGAGLMLVAELGSAAGATGTGTTYTFTTPGPLANYIETWPNVPDRANILDATVGTAQKYTVTIVTAADGSATVTVNVVTGTATP